MRFGRNGSRSTVGADLCLILYVQVRTGTLRWSVGPARSIIYFLFYLGVYAAAQCSSK